MKLINLEEVAARLGLAVNSVRQMVNRGEFIDPIQVSPRRIAFDQDELAAWIAKRPRGKFQQPAQLAISGLL